MASTTEAIAQVNTLATHTAVSAWNGASDFLIIIILLSIFFFFAWYIGRGQLVAVLLAFYCAYALYAMFPYKSYLPSQPPLTALLANVGVYAGLAFLFYVILRRVVVSDFLYVGVFGLIILSFLGAAFLVALAYHVFPIADFYHFTPAMDMFFANKQYFFWWFVSPAIGLFFLAR